MPPMLASSRRSRHRNIQRNRALGAIVAATLLLSGCAHTPPTGTAISAETPAPREAPAHWITLAEPGPREIVVVVNNNGFWGSHAGLFAGARLSDPAGSYKFRRSKLPGWPHPTLADYIRFQSADGMNIESYRFTLSEADFAHIEGRMTAADGALPLYCATAVNNAIAGVGPFRSVETVGWIVPATLADTLRPLTRGDAPAGRCELPDGSAC